MESVRCFTCGKVTCNLVEPYTKLRLQGMPHLAAMAKLNVRRDCCMRMLVSGFDPTQSRRYYEAPVTEGTVTDTDRRGARTCIVLSNRTYRGTHVLHKLGHREEGEEGTLASLDAFSSTEESRSTSTSAESASHDES